MQIKKLFWNLHSSIPGPFNVPSSALVAASESYFLSNVWAYGPNFIPIASKTANNAHVPSLKVQVAILAVMMAVVKLADNVFGMIFQTIWLKLSLLFCVNPPMHLCNNSSFVTLS